MRNKVGKNQYDGKHCKRGHILSETSTTYHEGTRRCKICIEKGRTKRKTNGTKKVYEDRARQKRTGWSTEQIQRTIKDQSNRCAICKRILFGDKFTCADHKHGVPPKPRGILCSNCNTGIGLLKESPKIMKSAISYLRKYENL